MSRVRVPSVTQEKRNFSDDFPLFLLYIKLLGGLIQKYVVKNHITSNVLNLQVDRICLPIVYPKIMATFKAIIKKEKMGQRISPVGKLSFKRIA